MSAEQLEDESDWLLKSLRMLSERDLVMSTRDLLTPVTVAFGWSFVLNLLNEVMVLLLLGV
jgi:hypothetical protein